MTGHDERSYSSMSDRTYIYTTHPRRVYLVLVLLCCGYFGKYFCTSDMYVVQTLFQKKEGISDVQLSTMFSFGYLGSVFGKVAAGVWSDTYGGKFTFTVSATGFIVLTGVFSYLGEMNAGNFAMYFVVWTVSGFFALGLAWVAIVAVATNWIPLPYMGRLMGLVSMAPQLGDVIARFVLSYFVHFGWKVTFRAASGFALALLLPIVLFGRDHPPEREETIQKAKVDDKKAQEASGKPKPSFMTRVKPLLKQPMLWLLCMVSGSLYGTRAIFLLYSTAFLAQVHCAGSDDMIACVESRDTVKATAQASTIYTLAGCVSVYFVGYLKDTLPKKHRALILAMPIVLLLAATGILSFTGADLPYWAAVTIVGVTGLCLFGPYKVLGTAFAVDIGGKELKATACSLMGIFDNIAAMLMLLVKGALGDDWISNFRIMAGLSLLALLCASLVWSRDLASAKPKVVAEVRHPLLPDQTEVFTRRERTESEGSERRMHYREHRTEQN